MKMTSSLHEAACHMAESDLFDEARGPVPLVGDAVLLPEVGNAVYIVTDESGEVVYVGSVARRGSVRSRMIEHLREEVKRKDWRDVWIVPLKVETQKERVRFLEGRIGRRLGYRGRLPSYRRAVGLGGGVAKAA